MTEIAEIVVTIGVIAFLIAAALPGLFMLCMGWLWLWDEFKG